MTKNLRRVLCRNLPTTVFNLAVVGAFCATGLCTSLVFAVQPQAGSNGEVPTSKAVTGQQQIQQNRPAQFNGRQMPLHKFQQTPFQKFQALGGMRPGMTGGASKPASARGALGSAVIGKGASTDNKILKKTDNGPAKPKTASSRATMQAAPLKKSVAPKNLPSMNERFTLVGYISGAYAVNGGGKNGVIILQDSHNKEKKYFVSVGSALPGMPGSKIIAVEQNRVIVGSSMQQQQITRAGFDDLGSSGRSYASNGYVGRGSSWGGNSNNSGSAIGEDANGGSVYNGEAGFGSDGSNSDEDIVIHNGSDYSHGTDAVINSEPPVNGGFAYENSYTPPIQGGGDAPSAADYLNTQRSMPFGAGRNFNNPDMPSTIGSGIDYSQLKENIRKAQEMQSEQGILRQGGKG